MVYGVPVGQGSKTQGRTKAGRVFLREDNPKVKPWRDRIAGAAADAMADRPLMLGAMVVHIAFGFPRPKSHYRKDGSLRPGAARFKTSKPDVDKLERALFDALTGVVWHDDAQVVQVKAVKVYGDPPRTEVRVVEIEHA